MKTYSTRLSAKDKMQLMGNLSTMLGAGIPILEAVESLLEEAKGNPKKILTTLQTDLKAGVQIHESFSKFPRAFNKVTINLLKAAEEAGNLEVALRDVKDSIQKEREFMDKVMSALTYPIFVLLIFGGVMIMMLLFVIPRISQVFSRLKMDLPLATRVMIFSSNLLMNYYVYVILFLVLIILGLAAFYYYKKSVLINMFASLPFLSGLMRQIDLTRFSRSMSLLLSSGLPIVSALELSEDVVLKSDLHKLLEKARQNVAAGKKFSEGLRSKRKLVPGIVIKLIEVGEKTGSLDKSMKDITEMLDYEVSKNLKTATSLLEPIMLVIVGLAVGGMMMAIIGPIYGLISNVGAR